MDNDSKSSDKGKKETESPIEAKAKSVPSLRRRSSTSKLEAAVNRHLPKASDFFTEFARRGITDEEFHAQLLRRAANLVFVRFLTAVVKDMAEE